MNVAYVKKRYAITTTDWTPIVAISNPFTVEFQQAFVNGICVLTSGVTNLTVIYD